ncbi:DUF58 domain-containing protein [Halomonas sp. ANAO-440]|uniref:DUF58 domain-containing protein n=1 Tax=Halomonas sp. ANAO-440 TaxID=2861360 RepID=UPI001CAA421F|nr:DUF58 domain-containing protein [Halomonas sp. ANAO-440]MBZ0331124.1 DUF58 domain-containing protein [Halomonas sp. ANAO-440]
MTTAHTAASEAATRGVGKPGAGKPNAGKKKRLRDWLGRRLTIAPGEALPQRRLFLIPTRFGLGWIALVAVLLLFGVNYQNSLAYALAFWLAGLAMVVLVRAWRNLLGVTVELQLPREAFAGHEARLQVILRAARPRTAIGLVLDAHETTLPGLENEASARLPWRPGQRGWQLPPTLRLESCWPLGLVRAVAWVQPTDGLLVYPAPLEAAGAEHRQLGAGLDATDFAGLRRFERGDSATRVAWKQWSRSGILTTKVFSVPPRQQLWLDYANCRGSPERRLSLLCARVLAHHRAGDHYGLRLPGLELPLAEGERQRRAALEALGLFQAGSTGGLDQ